jgi:hypothetical protein
MPYCPNCGNEVSEDDEYCSRCQQPLKGAPVRRVRPERPVRRRNEKGEKDEKDEKGEKGEKDEKGEKSEKHEDPMGGAITGGMVVIWLGISILLRNAGYFNYADFGGVFLLGLGVILIIRGLWMYAKSGILSHSFGFLIGGAFVALLGGSIAFDLREWWALFLIGLGIIIVVRAFTERSKNPVP